MQEVKNLIAKDLSTVGQALKRAFDLLNMFRLQTNIDNYGQVFSVLFLASPQQGRFPWFAEPAQILLLTDGSALTNVNGVVDSVRTESVTNNVQLTLPLNPTPGSELTLEPFRWDQRLHSVVLQFPGSALPPNPQLIQKAEQLLSPMSEVTGGNKKSAGKK